MASRPQKVIMIRSETDIFTENAYDVCIQNSGIVVHHPTATISDNTAPITFFIQGNDTQYVDLSQTSLYIRGKITAADGSAVGEVGAMSVAPVNNFLHSLFQQVSVHLNENHVTSQSSLYAYRAYLEAMLSFSGDYEQSQAAAVMYNKDRSADVVVGTGFEEAQNRIKDGKEFDMIGRPHVDICGQNRYIIPGIDIRFTLHRTPSDFYMAVPQVAQQAKGYSFTITQAKLLVKKHTLLPSILLNHIKIWESGIPASYPMRKVEMKSYTLPKDTIENVNENLLNGLLPDRIIVALVATSALHGKLGENPFFLSHYGLKHIGVSANGEQNYHREYDVDFTNGLYTEPYYDMFSNLGVDPLSDGPFLTMEEYKGGKTVFVFSLRDVREGFALPKYGSVRIDLKFSPALTKGVTVVVHADYQSVYYIDKTKSVYPKDYSNSKE
jgi:hypothetical protein